MSRRSIISLVAAAIVGISPIAFVSTNALAFLPDSGRVGPNVRYNPRGTYYHHRGNYWRGAGWRGVGLHRVGWRGVGLHRVGWRGVGWRYGRRWRPGLAAAGVAAAGVAAAGIAATAGYGPNYGAGPYTGTSNYLYTTATFPRYMCCYTPVPGYGVTAAGYGDNYGFGNYYGGYGRPGWGGVGWRGVGWRGVGWHRVGWRGVGWRGVGWHRVGWRGVGRHRVGRFSAWQRG